MKRRVEKLHRESRFIHVIDAMLQDVVGGGYDENLAEFSLSVIN